MLLQAEKNLRLLNILAFINNFRTYEGVLVVFFVAITESYTVAMAMFAIMHITSSIMEVPTGILSDQIGRRKTIILYIFSNLLAILLFYLANSTAYLVFGTILIGISISLSSGTISAFVYENLETLGKTDLYKKFEGKRKAQSMYALTIAGLIGALVIYLYDIRTALLITLVLTFAALVLSFFLADLKKFKPNKANIYHDLSTALKEFKNNASLRDLSLGRIFARGLGNAEYRFRSLFFSSIMPDWLVNLLITFGNLATGLVMHINHFIVGKIGAKRSLVHLNILEKVLVSILAFIYTPVAAFLMTLVTSTNYGVRDIASEDLLQARYTKNQRATMGSLVGLGGSAVYVITALLTGLLADQIGLLGTIIILQLAFFIAIYFFWRGVESKV